LTACPSCGVSLPSAAISEQLSAARCPACRTLVDLGSSRRTEARSLAVAQPERWQVEATPGSLKVRWRWFTLPGLLLVPFTLFWNGVLLGMAFSASDGFQHPERLLVGLVVPHVWVGIGLAYFTVATFLNSTTVQVSEGVLHVRSGPLPWRGNRTIPVRELQQLFVMEKRANRGGVSYELCGLLRNGKRQSLLSGLSDEGSARFLEVKLEQVMSIADQSVAGELRK